MRNTLLFCCLFSFLLLNAQTEEKAICFPGYVQLTVSGSMNDFSDAQWLPTIGLAGANTLTPTFTPTAVGDYTFTFTAKKNLITNGNFEEGDTGFITDYALATYQSDGTTLHPEGVYVITTDVSTVHQNSNCRFDHTAGTGNMMAVNGAASSSMIVWQPIDAITVMPNTDYVFSAWVMNWGDTGNNLPELQFQINGVDISTPISPSATPCLWTQLSVTWNSGSSTSAVITLLNKQSAGGGNDFSIDDMSFHELGKIETYQFNVAVRNCSFTENKTMCSDETMLFNSSDNSVYTDILWSPATGLTGTTSSKPTFKPSSAGMHIFTFTGKNELGLTITKTFNVDVETCPFIETNVTTCLEETLVLNDDDTDVYTNIQWLPTTGLTGASTSKPTFKPIAVGNFTYTMKAEKSGVKVRKKIHVQVVQCIPPPPPPPPPVPIIPDKFFTPNNDGCNDVWTVQGLEEYSGIIVEIYDRAGVRLISFDGNFSGWDGKYNGQPMPAGDYWYVIAIGETAQRMVGHFVLRR